MATPKRTTRSKRTREELQQEVVQIAEDVERESRELSTVEQTQRAEETVAAAAVAESFDIDATVQRLAATGVEVTRTLNDLGSKLRTEAEGLASLHAAAKATESRLEEVYKIEVVAQSLKQVLADHEKCREELNQEIATARHRWEEEKATQARDGKEYDENLKKQRARERDDYEYQNALERKRDEDAYAQKSKDLDRQLAERKLTQEKLSQEREAKVAAAEAELNDLRKQAAEWPEKLKLECVHAVQAAIQQAEAKFSHQMELVQKDREGEKRLLEQRTQTLEAALARQVAEAEELRTKLDDANHQVQAVALKAIEGASGAQALAHVNKIAMEQAKKSTQS
jgi:colicin import membrane protein